ncbi:MAG: carbohydrate-binding protein [Oscillospiraceae bacterium]|nr:carbohydrate-binding protein [Oscillospiraceae bacterium]
MAVFTIKVVDELGNIKAQDSAEEIASLVYKGDYAPGDHILVETSEKNIYVWLQVDDVLGRELVYLTDNTSYRVPFEEKKDNINPIAFTGELHYLYVRQALDEEVYSYRNQARNVCDQHDIKNLYPHAFANVETRGEATFFACNAIDGMWENRSHGKWPYQSWGINRQEDAEITVDFGRLIETDKVVIFTRADFPHDNWWTQVTVSFSDGTSIDWKLEDKFRFAQTLQFEKKCISWIKLSNLIKADDPSPFPALSQIEVYGTVVR